MLSEMNSITSTYINDAGYAGATERPVLDYLSQMQSFTREESSVRPWLMHLSVTQHKG